MDDLDTLLKRAAEAKNWPNVLHRCAWCNHLFDEHGTCRAVMAIKPKVVATDGMCERCGANALAAIRARKQTPRAA
jgi:hypothetical protein